MFSYKTVGQEATVETVIKKSRFIAHVQSIQAEEEANEFIRSVSKVHREATHNVYAYRLSDQAEKCSDDGEPSGTAGKPVLSVLKGAELYRVVVVVTRYYGGTLLGAGGLVRAYTQSASQGIAEAGVVTRILCQRLQVEFEMPLFGLIKKVIEQSSAKILQIAVTDRAMIVARLPLTEVERLETQLIEVSAGKVIVKKMEQEYV
ncbi:YigZ family protein [Desulfotomaculum defluvii]